MRPVQLADILGSRPQLRPSVNVAVFLPAQPCPGCTLVAGLVVGAGLALAFALSPRR